MGRTARTGRFAPPGGTVRSSSSSSRWGSPSCEQRQDLADLDILAMGITFTVYTDGQGHRPGVALRRDPPGHRGRRVAARSSAGLVQRLAALNLFIDDVYNEQADPRRRRRSRPSCSTSSVNFRPECVGVRPPLGVWAHICGSDLVRDADGTVYVLEDNLRVPLGRVLHAREPAGLQAGLRRPVPAPEHPAGRRLPRPAPPMLRVAGARGPHAPDVVVLTPGIYNSAYFEHSFLARRMGVPLVEGRDLFVGDDDVVYMRTIDGPRAGRRDLPPRRRPVPRPRGVPRRLDARACPG